MFNQLFFSFSTQINCCIDSFMSNIERLQAVEEAPVYHETQEQLEGKEEVEAGVQRSKRHRRGGASVLP